MIQGNAERETLGSIVSSAGATSECRDSAMAKPDELREGKNIGARQKGSVLKTAPMRSYDLGSGHPGRQPRAEWGGNTQTTSTYTHSPDLLELQSILRAESHGKPTEGSHSCHL